ncbi:hypothetical protein RDI58_018258 [Solanum bulbocastanum]|uniref:Replication factor C C-terminal domain-containing protein n=1 Tax=Solanum bulbocastanum TaxID=147425 RepID=A0AAN8TAC4_SOLBU
MDKKHVSLPRSTVVHSNPNPSKDQPIAANMRDRQNGEESCSRNCRDSEGLASSLTRILQGQPRNALAKPGKVVVHVWLMIWEIEKNMILGLKSGMQEGMNSHSKPMAPCGMAAKLAQDIAINIDSNPFYMMRAGVTKSDRVDDRITIDTNLLQAKSQYGGIGVAAAAATTGATHRKVETVQYVMVMCVPISPSPSPQQRVSFSLSEILRVSAARLFGSSISAKDLISVSGVIPNEVVQAIFSACRSGNFELANKEVNNVIAEGYPVSQLLSQLYDIVVDADYMSDEQKARICKKFAEADKCHLKRRLIWFIGLLSVSIAEASNREEYEEEEVEGVIRMDPNWDRITCRI